MNINLNTDVLIVGAGPTGLSLACQFIRLGVDFVIIDTKENITPFSKAIGVQARTLEIYEQIGLADSLVELGAKAEKAQLWEGGEVRGEIELADLGEGLSPYPFLLLVEQSKHEHLLNDFLTEHGKQVFWQTELVDFSQDASGVTAHLQNGDIVNAKFLVGCDGAKSVVRHKLGLEFEGSTFARLFYVADVEIIGQLDHNAVHICLAQNTITAFFPIKGDNRYRIVGTFPEGHDKEEGEVIYAEIEQQIIEDTKLHLDITKVNWFSTYKVHSRHVDKFSKERCFVAGDAAHIHTPAGAQGMNTGIQDAYNLAWKLSLVLKGNANDNLLKTYNEERLENARHLLQTTDRVFDFGANTDPAIAFFRTHIFPYVAGFALSFDAVKNFAFPLISQIGVNYHHSALSEKTDSHFAVKAGDRMPYFRIENKSIYDVLRQPKFHWITFTNDQKDISAMLGEIENLYPDLIDFQTVSLTPKITDIFGVDELFYVLLRPDNYIGIITFKTSVSEIRGYFNRFGC
jgi:2-polyprenyl-6-methoxyphenol hydroxylase-like FAD-dependent oxidoreductase